MEVLWFGCGGGGGGGLGAGGDVNIKLAGLGKLNGGVLELKFAGQIIN